MKLNSSLIGKMVKIRDWPWQKFIAISDSKVWVGENIYLNDESWIIQEEEKLPSERIGEYARKTISEGIHREIESTVFAIIRVLDEEFKKRKKNGK